VRAHISRFANSSDTLLTEPIAAIEGHVPLLSASLYREHNDDFHCSGRVIGVATDTCIIAESSTDTFSINACGPPWTKGTLSAK
jgi:hypothetical protein